VRRRMPQKPTPRPAPNRPIFNWDELGRCKAGRRFLNSYPSDVRTFYSPKNANTNR
jgi:hypothetical protein